MSGQLPSQHDGHRLGDKAYGHGNGGQPTYPPTLPGQKAGKEGSSDDLQENQSGYHM